MFLLHQDTIEVRRGTRLPYHIEECLAGPRVDLDRRWGRASCALPAPVADYALGLCRRIDGNHAADLMNAFLDVLEHSPRAGARSELPPAWFEAPWYALDPAHFFERSTRGHSNSELALGLRYVRELGFHNVALLGSSREQAAAARALAAARDLGLRVLTTLDLERGSPQAAPWLRGQDPTSVAVVRRALLQLAQDVARGAGGEHFHHVDRWARAAAPTPQATDAVHALVALFKLFLLLLGRQEVVLSDYAEDHRALASLVGGEVPFAAATRSREGDLVFWWEGMMALRRALLEEDARTLDDALGGFPRLGHGAALACALEDLDRELPRLGELLDGDRERLTLAIELLFSFPAVPFLEAGVETGARGHRLLARSFLHAHETRTAPIQALLRCTRDQDAPRGRPRPVPAGHRAVAAWLTGQRLVVVNLGPLQAHALIPRAALDEALGAPLLELAPLDPAHVRPSVLQRAELRLELRPRELCRYQLRSRLATGSAAPEAAPR